MAHVLKFIAAALVTAPVSSCVGGFLTMVADASSMPPDNLILVWVLVTVFGAILSFPALLFIAAPLTLPFLDSMPDHRVAATIGFVLLGAFVSLPAAMVAGGGGYALMPAVITGAVAGLVWVNVVMWLHDPPEAE